MNAKPLRGARKALYVFLTVVMIAGFLTAFAILAIDGVDWWRARVVRQEVQQLYQPSGSLDLWDVLFASALASAQPQPSDSPWQDESPANESQEIQEDFRALYERNPDVIGWLTAGESIGLPVVQRDNEYYLSHNFFGELDSNGTVFLNEMNVLSPRDHVLLVHGHNMRSGEMFGKLTQYEDEAYMRQHPLISFRAVYEEQASYYVPIACFNASMIAHASGYFDVRPVHFATEEACQDYLDEVLGRSYWSAPAEVAPQDELLLLLTCSYQHEDGRFLLFCSKLRDDETAEQMQSLYQPS